MINIKTGLTYKSAAYKTKGQFSRTGLFSFQLWLLFYNAASREDHNRSPARTALIKVRVAISLDG